MGKQMKSSKSKSKSASKKPQPKLVQGSIGNASVEDRSFGSSRTCFRSAISCLKDVDFNLPDHFNSSDGDDDEMQSPLKLASVPAESTLKEHMDSHIPAFDAGFNKFKSAVVENGVDRGSPNLISNISFSPANGSCSPSWAARGTGITAGNGSVCGVDPCVSPDSKLLRGNNFESQSLVGPDCSSNLQSSALEYFVAEHNSPIMHHGEAASSQSAGWLGYGLSWVIFISLARI